MVLRISVKRAMADVYQEFLGMASLDKHQPFGTTATAATAKSSGVFPHKASNFGWFFSSKIFKKQGAQTIRLGCGPSWLGVRITLHKRSSLSTENGKNEQASSTKTPRFQRHQKLTRYPWSVLNHRDELQALAARLTQSLGQRKSLKNRHRTEVPSEMVWVYASRVAKCINISLKKWQVTSLDVERTPSTTLHVAL